jgi:N-carbamoyl-L-amino-acid hydrolase
MKEDLSLIEYLGSYNADFRMNPLNAHFELHIEQERNLQDRKKEIGVVTGIQGVRWYMVTISGVQGHAGSTPMNGRADSHVAAAEMIIQVQKLALIHSAVGTVGLIRTEKPSANKIPGFTEFSIDFRHPSEEILNEFECNMKTELSRISSDNPKFTLEMTRIWCSPVANFDDLAIECVRSAAVKEVGLNKIMEMISFAGHDSALVSNRAPTAMIFVPCKDGVSHSPLEHSTKEQW